MTDTPKLNEALKRILELGYPPATLTLPPSMALGFRLASRITAKTNMPSRPFALADGLAVRAADVILREAPVEQSGPLQDNGAAEGSAAPSEDGEQDGPQDAGESPAGAAAEQATAEEQHESRLDATVRLNVRPAESFSKYDAPRRGDAAAVQIGAEIPKGFDYLVPAEFLAGPPLRAVPEVPDAPADAAPRAEPQRDPRRPRDRRNANEDDDLAPKADPARDWDLLPAYAGQSLELPRIPQHSAPDALVPIGSWARSRDELLAERTVIRPGELALLEALGIEEVEVYRRPVVAVVSLGQPLPTGQRRGDGPPRDNRRRRRPDQAAVAPAGTNVAVDSDTRAMGKSASARAEAASAEPLAEENPEPDYSGACPLSALVQHLCRASQVAALPLGYASDRMLSLRRKLDLWLSQCDVLIFVGGSHHGPRCLAQDLIASEGELAVAGMDLAPGGGLSVGTIGGKPVVAMPGSLPDVLVGYLLAVRPLLHKYLTPLYYSAEIPLVLECGSRLQQERDSAVAVRYTYNTEQRCFATRYSGPWRGDRSRAFDPWLEYVRGQGIVVLEGGRSYRDGDVVTAYPY